MGERIVRGDGNNDRTHPNLDTSGEDEDGGLDGALLPGWGSDGEEAGCMNDAMMSALSLMAWESESDLKNRLAAQHPGKQADEWLQMLINYICSDEIIKNFIYLSAINKRSKFCFCSG